MDDNLESARNQIFQTLNCALGQLGSVVGAVRVSISTIKSIVLENRFYLDRNYLICRNTVLSIDGWVDPVDFELWINWNSHRQKSRKSGIFLRLKENPRFFKIVVVAKEFLVELCLSIESYQA